MTTFKWLASCVLAANMVPALPAKTHCPGNVASVPLHLLNGYQMVVAVSVNHSGPYQFLLDTGTQTTTIDPSLAVELGLTTQGAEAIAGVGFQTSASSAQLNLLEAGSHEVANLKVLVYSLHNFQSNRLTIQGVLGEDFLEHFDVLIDNAHSLLCLDDSAAMRAGVKGPHIALVMPVQTPDGAPLSRSLIVESRLSDAMRPVRLWLDSGTNVPFLYNPSEYMARRTSQYAPQQGTGGNGQQHVYVALPAQDLKIGPVELPSVTFFTFAGTSKGSSISEFDGLLTTGLLGRIFICHADHFVILDPR
jgi:Aspartyl protease